MKKAFPICLFLLLYCAGATMSAQQAVQAELQLGPGFVRDSGEGPSTGTVNIGTIVWFARHLGLGGHYVLGMGDDRDHEPVVSGDRTFMGTSGLRQAAVTLELRSFEARGLEMNFGVGISHLSFDDKTLITGIRRPDGSIEPTTPRLFRERISTRAIRTQLLVGHRIGGPFILKGGLSYDLTGETHPFQPLVLVVFRPN